MKKVKKAQPGLSLLAKYAGKSTAKNLGRSLEKAKIKRSVEEQVFDNMPYKSRIEASRKLEDPRSMSSMFGSARKDFQSATRPSAQNPMTTVPKSSSTVKKSIRKNYEGFEKGGSVKKAQLGSLLKAGAKTLGKAASKTVAKSATTPLKKPKLSLIDQDAKRALQKSIEKRKNPSKKLSYEDEILRSYQKNGGVTKRKSIKKK
jgi:hypothetical protein